MSGAQRGCRKMRLLSRESTIELPKRIGLVRKSKLTISRDFATLCSEYQRMINHNATMISDGVDVISLCTIYTAVLISLLWLPGYISHRLSTIASCSSHTETLASSSWYLPRISASAQDSAVKPSARAAICPGLQ